MNKEKQIIGLRELLDRIYPLQVWNENNKEQAIFISPTLQKSHKELLSEELEKFLLKALKAQRKEIVEEIEKIRSNTIGCGDVLDEIKNLITKEDETL